MPTKTEVGLWLLEHPWVNTYVALSLWLVLATFNTWWGVLIYIVVFLCWIKFYNSYGVSAAMETGEKLFPIPEAMTLDDKQKLITLIYVWNGQYLAKLMIPLTVWFTGIVILGGGPLLLQMGIVVHRFLGV